MWGTDIQNVCHLLWGAALIGLFVGYFRPAARLSSSHCMLCVMFCCACCWFPQCTLSYAPCSISRLTDLYIAGANIEELAIVNLIAEQEGIEPRPQKKWDRFLGEFGNVAFAIAPSTPPSYVKRTVWAAISPAF